MRGKMAWLTMDPTLPKNVTCWSMMSKLRLEPWPDIKITELTAKLTCFISLPDDQIGHPQRKMIEGTWL